jgi:uncharacterized protein YbbK (DUF523 family)
MIENFPKPVVVVSKCLGFEHCRYDGEMIDAPFVEKLKAHVLFCPVCPEGEIGLGVPRKPIRIVRVDDANTLYQPATGKDLTDPMRSFLATFLASLTDVDGFLLKSRSPTCGVNDVKIYAGFEASYRTSRGSGFLGGEVLEKFSGLPVEDEGRIRNFTIREHFLTRIFTFARFRQVKNSGSMRNLVNFHSIQKLLLMGCNQAQMRILGKIVANYENEDFETIVTCYDEHLKQALATPNAVELSISQIFNFSKNPSIQTSFSHTRLRWLGKFWAIVLHAIDLSQDGLKDFNGLLRIIGSKHCGVRCERHDSILKLGFFELFSE